MRILCGKLLVAACMAALIVLAAFTVSTQAAVPKPATPTFTAEFIDNSYDVPATTSQDPYTGQMINNPSHHVENYTIELTIKNQPYTQQQLQMDGWNASFFYNIRVKEYYTGEWITLYSPDSYYPRASNTEYTNLTYSSRGDNGLPYNDRMFQRGNQMDFQVQALIGAVHRGFNASATNQLEMYPYVFDGETSDWSNTQTVTIPGTDGSPSPTKAIPTVNTGPITPPPTFMDLTFGEIVIIVSLIAFTILLTALLMIWRKNPPNRRKN